MHAEEIHLCHLDAHSIHDQRNWDGSDETCELAFGANTDNPVGDVAWWVQRPSEEVNGVVKAELAVGVLNIVVRQ